MLLAVYSSKTAEEILAIDGEAELSRLDLAAHLSPTRKNGLFAMVQRVRELAAAQEAMP
ncbi:MAG: SufE family protein [Limisphaerales bacterium]